MSIDEKNDTFCQKISVTDEGLVSRIAKLPEIDE